MGCRSTVSDYSITEGEIEQNLDELAELGYVERTVVNGVPQYEPTEAGRERFEELGRYDPEEHRRRKKAKLERIRDAMTDDEKRVLMWMNENDVGGFVLKEEVAEATGLTEDEAEEALIGLSAFGLVDAIRHG